LHWLTDEETPRPTDAIRDDGSAPGHEQRFASTFGAHIVLADDNADMRRYVGGLLAPRYDVASVADGEQALSAIRRRRPELVLSDVMMPRLDGFGLLLRAESEQRLRLALSSIQDHFFLLDEQWRSRWSIRRSPN